MLFFLAFCCKLLEIVVLLHDNFGQALAVGLMVPDYTDVITLMVDSMTARCPGSVVAEQAQSSALQHGA